MNHSNKTACFTTLLCAIAVAVFLFGFGRTEAEAQEKKNPPKIVIPVPDKDELPTKAEYDRALKQHGEWTKKFNDVDYWKAVKLIRVSDKKEFHIKDLDDYDRGGFFLSALRRCTFEMTRLNGYWEDEAKEYAAKPPTQKDVPTADEVKKYIGQLTVIRKEAAKTLETYAEKFVKDNPAKITKEEGDLLLKSIREYNDEHKLIERKK